MRASNDDPPSLTRVASGPVLSAPWSKAAAAAARFATTTRPLPTVFRTPMVAHTLSPRVPAPRRLHALVASLHGRLAVVNPTRAAGLPPGLVSAVHGLVRTGFDSTALVTEEGWAATTALHPSTRGQSRARPGSDPRGTYELRMARALLSSIPCPIDDNLTDGVSWAVLALYESATPVLRLTASGGSNASDGSATAVAVAEIVYRLAIITGRDTPDEWPALDLAAVSAPAAPWPPRPPARGGDDHEDAQPSRPWFIAPLLVPDVWLAAHADPETLAHWARLTGRSGGPDRYWFPETWDRFLEPGRRVGWLTANDVWRPRRGRLASAASPRPDAEDDAAPTYPYSAMTLTPDLERGVGVPPGYALIQCVGTLEVAVVAGR